MALVLTIRGSARALAAVVVVTAGAARAQAPDPAPDSLIAAVEAAVTSGHLPGAQVLVSHNGHIVLDRGFGVQSLTGMQPVDVDTRVEIGSITKQFTAAAILQLVEQHKLSLDDSLGKFVDERGLSDFATGYTRVHGARASSRPMATWALGAG